MKSKGLSFLLSMLLTVYWMSSASGFRDPNNCAGKPSDVTVDCILWKLLEGYDKTIRPNFPGPPIDISLEMLISNVFDVSEVSNEFSVEVYFRQFWNDKRLGLSKFNYTSPLFLNSESIKELWKPSTYFVKSKRAHLHHITTDNVLLRISPNGDVFYSQRLSVAASCIMDLRYFPHDTQKCNLTMESYAYQDKDITYSWGKKMFGYFDNIRSEVFDVPSFEIMAVTLDGGKNHYSIGNHSFLLATFVFQRKVGFFLIETYIPSCIVVIISWVSFWIPAESSPARVSLGITTVLTMTTISSSARQSLPKVSYVKVIDWFLLVCLVFVFAALLEYAFVVHYNTKLKHKDAADAQRKKFHEKKMKHRRTFLAASDTHDKSSDWESCGSDLSIDENGFCKWLPVPEEGFLKSKKECRVRQKFLSDMLVLSRKIDNVSRKAFPAAFISFLCIYWLKITLSAG